MSVCVYVCVYLCLCVSNVGSRGVPRACPIYVTWHTIYVTWHKYPPPHSPHTRVCPIYVTWHTVQISTHLCDMAHCAGLVGVEREREREREREKFIDNQIDD